MAKNNPEISINKLAEFVNASEARKRSVLKTIKSSTPEDASKRNRYQSAKSAICTFMVDIKHDLKIFEQKRTQLLEIKTESPQRNNDIKNSIEAIKILEKLAQKDLIPLLKFKFTRGLPKENRNTKMNGILIHLSPDMLLHTKEENIIGFIKLIFSKGRQITPLEGQIISGLLGKAIEQKYKIKLSKSNCISLDVFGKRIYTAPDSFTYHSRLLRKSFSEINNLWSKI